MHTAVTPLDRCRSSDAMHRPVPGVLTMWRWGNVLGAAVLLLVLAAVFHNPVAHVTQPVVEAVLAAVVVVWGLLDHVFFIPKRYEHYRYAVRDDAVVIMEGFLVTRKVEIPVSKILYVETRENPVTRRWGVVNVVVGTIADSFRIPAVPFEVSTRIREAAGVQGVKV